MNVFFSFCISLVAFTLAAALPVGGLYAEEPPSLKGVGLESVNKSVSEQTFLVEEDGAKFVSMHIPLRLYYAYNKQTNGFFIKIPENEQVFGINLLKRIEGVPEAIVEKVGTGLDLLGYKTTQWRIYSLGQLCADVFTSTDAAQNIGFDFADQMRIRQGLAEAFSTPKLTDDKCENFVIKPALGSIMGLALAFSGRMGEGRVTNIQAKAEMPNKFITPKASKMALPIDDATRKEVILMAMPAHNRQQMRKLFENTTAEQAVNMLATMRRQKEALKKAAE